MIEAIATEPDTLVPASVVLDGEYGINGVSLSVPVALGRKGVTRIEEWDLAADDRQGLRDAAARVDEAVRDLRLP